MSEHCKHHWTPPPECPYCCADERDQLRAELEQSKEAWRQIGLKFVPKQEAEALARVLERIEWSTGDRFPALLDYRAKHPKNAELAASVPVVPLSEDERSELLELRRVVARIQMEASAKLKEPTP